MYRSVFACLVVVVAVAALAAAPRADLSGTWLGVTQVPDIGEDRLRLELKAEGQTYTGVLVDSAGIVVPNPITKVKVDGATLTFDVVVNNGQTTFAVHITLKADGDSLAGNWATDEGATAPMTFTRQK